jgi:hypothetical protein
MRRHDEAPIDVTIAGSPDDPRTYTAPEGVRIHRVPDLHPDDVVTLPGGLRVTSVARTLVDLAEDMNRDELRATFECARRRGLLDLAAVRAARRRVEWRPSLQMLDEVIAEFSTPI